MVHGKHWPALNLGDITTVDWSTVEPVDLLTAGYPCQPFSTAGRRKGTDDERHLWPHVADAVRVLRPRRAFLENVAGHLSLGFDVVLADLAALGYSVRWGCVRASDAGAPHRRERLFILATDPSGAGTGWDDRAVPGQVQGRARVDVRAAGDDRGPAADTGSAGAGRDDRRGPATDPDGVAGATTIPWRRGPGAMGEPGAIPGAERLHRPPIDWGDYEPAIRRWEHVLGRPAPRPTEPSPRSAIADRRGEFTPRERLSPPFVEWMMGLPAGWVTGHGLPRTAELKMLGNGVVPQAAALAWSLLSEPFE